MKTLSAVLLALSGLAAGLPAAAATAGPSCPPLGAGPQSTNWGTDYREKIRDVFDAVKAAAGPGISPDLRLINVNDLRPQNAGLREVDGTPLAAVPKGTEGLTSDAVIYTYGVFEIACDEAQLAFFMAHEMRHIKRGPDGKNHFDRVNACRRRLFLSWYDAREAAVHPSVKEAFPVFLKEQGREVATQCVLPVEREADDFAIALAPKLPWRVKDPAAPDPNRDERVRAFRNAEHWTEAIGESGDDPGHGSLDERARRAYDASFKESMRKQAEAERRARQSLPRGF